MFWITFRNREYCLLRAVLLLLSRVSHFLLSQIELRIRIKERNMFLDFLTCKINIMLIIWTVRMVRRGGNGGSIAAIVVVTVVALVQVQAIVAIAGAMSVVAVAALRPGIKATGRASRDACAVTLPSSRCFPQTTLQSHINTPNINGTSTTSHNPVPPHSIHEHASTSPFRRPSPFFLFTPPFLQHFHLHVSSYCVSVLS